ncbi:TubC N-terminal docking domain-related protein [Variovorax arabinosiphilus]|uniref:TubC N-terminal docking domain-related protein n=1 Tax=Variovorax arabinosiphilus TaxID=3053498 RepID=UPI0025781ABE|nr:MULTISPECIES: hypothetical protein [unclassified Variovorax]MDM0118907.1 hypothetical protein [Variovorax sp. J2L1-78]MDM0129332.1 hypothetical protein [Variovorax sp. J2L1-63]MDM0232881.1 hypothetical protein [Variovorax sp. J2R1-6]
MSPVEICRTASSAGISLRVDGENLIVKPANRLTPALRVLLVAHKPELLAFVQTAHETTVQLVAAAMRACDLHGDGAKARAEMREDCLATPIHLQAELLAYFREQYGRQA